MSTLLSPWTRDHDCYRRLPLYEEAVLEKMRKEQDPNQWEREAFKRMKKNIQSDKELNLFPTLQRIDILSEDVKLLMKSLEQIKDNVKELKKRILEE